MRKLETDDRMADEFLTKCAALVCVFHGFFVADARKPKTLDYDADAFMVEIRHNY